MLASAVRPPSAGCQPTTSGSKRSVRRRFGFTVAPQQFKGSHLFCSLIHFGTKVRHVYCGGKTTLAPSTLRFEAQRKRMKGEEASTKGSESLLAKGAAKIDHRERRSSWGRGSRKPWGRYTAPASLSNRLCLLLMSRGAF